LPGVTLERDEGEGKYIQIRGTEPKLSNVTIDGVEVPSPEGGVRQVKLDTIPADLVESVQINKTLQANLSADAIGGTVNIGQGFTPIAGGVPVSELSGTLGQRFGTAKRFGALVGGTYDYNGRKTYDLEPVPGILPDNINPTYSSTDIRQYEFTRHRYGFGVSGDYKLSDSTSIYAHSLYSIFKDYGRRYAYTLNTNPASVQLSSKRAGMARAGRIRTRSAGGVRRHVFGRVGPGRLSPELSADRILKWGRQPVRFGGPACTVLPQTYFRIEMAA
jgi:TonB-dependent Receptor Plug Domain